MKLMKIAILMAITAAFAVLAHGAISAYLTQRAIDAARTENAALRSRHAALRDAAFELGAQAEEEIGRGYQLARSAGRGTRSQPRDVCAPSRSAADHAIIHWLSSQEAQLESLAGDLSYAQTGFGVKQAAAAPLVPSSGPADADEGIPASDSWLKVAERRPPSPHRSAKSVTH